MPSWESVQATERVCIECGGKFKAKRSNAKRCSAKCRDRARIRQPTDKTRERSRQWYHDKLATDPNFRAKIREQERVRSEKVKQWVRAYKMRKGCVDCGYNKHYAALDFDHEGTKRILISHCKSIEAVKREIRLGKCVVRCANCHRIKSWETKTWIKKTPLPKKRLSRKKAA